MGRLRDWPTTTAAVALLLCVLSALPSTASAQEWDPAAAISAYSVALNTHDVDRALALFDENGSATDAAGHHFEGRDGLREFLLTSGFGDPTASIATERLHVVANRALWTYSCSCSAGPTDVRLVMNHSRISVFAITAPIAPPIRRAEPGVMPWMVGLGLAAGGLAAGYQLAARRSRGARPPLQPRPSQGRLLAALVSYNAGRAESERVELPAAAMTSFSDSEESAAPCSR